MIVRNLLSLSCLPLVSLRRPRFCFFFLLFLVLTLSFSSLHAEEPTATLKTDSDVAPSAVTLKEYYSHVEMPDFEGEKVLRVGETLVYRINCKRAPAGTATLMVKRKTVVRGKEAYYVTLEAESNRATSLLYKVLGSSKSYIDAENFSSMLYVRRIQEGTYRSHSADDYLEFDYQGGMQSLIAVSPEGERTSDTRAIPGNLQDPLSVIYYLRNFPLKVGEKRSVLVATEENPQTLIIDVLREETLTIPALGEVNTLAVSLKSGGGSDNIYNPGFFRSKGDIIVWVEKSTNIPVKSVFHLPVLGRAVAILSHFENSELSEAIQVP